MAIASLSTSVASGSSATADQASLAVTFGTAVAAGSALVVMYALDNNATADGDEVAVSFISDSVGNTYLKGVEFTNANAAAQAGATNGIWYCAHTDVAITTSTVLTAHFKNKTSRDATAISVSAYSKASGKVLAVEGTAGTLANDAAAAGSLSVTTTNIECLRVRSIASESSTATALTKTAAFTATLAEAGTTGGASAGNMWVRGEYVISTTTAVASAPTGGAGAVDNASTYLCLKEVNAAAVGLPFALSNINTFTSTLGPYQSNIEVSQMNSVPASLTFDTWGETTGPVAVGCAFTTASANSITDVTIWIGNSGSPTDGVVCDIYATSGGFPTGGSLGTSDVVSSQLETMQFGDILMYPHKFTFATPVAVSSATVYAAVLTRTGALDAAFNKYAISCSTSPVLATEQLVNQGSWSTRTGQYPLFFVGTTQTKYVFFCEHTSPQSGVTLAKISTAPDTLWTNGALQACSTGEGIGTVKSFSGFQIGNIIHICIGIDTGSTTAVYDYYQYNISTNAFTTSEVAYSPGNTTGGAGVIQTGVSVGVRRTGEVVLFANATQVLSGTNRTRVSYLRRTAAATWAAAVAVDAGGAFEYNIPEVMLSWMNDRVHFGFWTGTTTYNLRTLTGTNTLGTNQTSAFTASVGQPTQGTMFRRAAGQYAGLVTVNGGSSTAVNSGIRFDSADGAAIGGVATILGSGGAAPMLVFSEQEKTLGVGGITTNVYAMLRKSADSDLYIYKSTDSGVNWDSGTLAIAGTFASAGATLSRDGMPYIRGTNVVIPYIAYDSASNWYNEYTIRSTLSPYLPYNPWPQRGPILAT